MSHEKDKARIEELLERFGYVWEREYQFCEERFWKADWAVHACRVYELGWREDPVGILIEYEGGTFQRGGGGHNRGGHYEKDCVKYSTAALLGWTVLRVTGELVRTGVLERWLREWPTVWIEPTWWRQREKKKSEKVS